MTDTITATRSRLQRFQGRYPEIAERFGLSYSTLSKFANGERGKRPSFDFITTVRTALDELEGEIPTEQVGHG